jgi:tetratricopeptide (TPR) repeat protein
MLGEWDEAIWEYSEEILHSPDDGGTYFNRALVWREKRELEPMRKDLDQAVKLSPGLAPAWQLRGNIRELFQNDPAGALEDYRQALKVGGENWRSRKIVEENIAALKKRLEEK